MVRLCLLGCVVLLAACGEKAPEEGALRVSVKYGSFKPNCVRVEVQDAHGHQGATDIPASQFQKRETQEVLVAVLRKAEWDRELSVTVSSLASAANGRCDGAVLERFSSQPIPIPLKAFARHEVTLEAVDGDGDGAPVNVPWAEGSDCDDKDPRFHPGAAETCTGTDDFNCNTLKGCAETGCRDAACDDGNLCTDNDRCSGVGTAATCQGSARQCNAGASCMVGVCDQGTGLCSTGPAPSGTSCVDANACTVGDTCNGNGACVSGTPTPCPEKKCFLAASGCVANNTCNYPPDPAQVGDFCLAPSGLTTGVCRSGDGACSAFPFRPNNFDPDVVDPADLVALNTSGNVTFNSDTRAWVPSNNVTNPNQIKPRVLPQVGGELAPVLIPVSSVSLGGTLTLVGSRPVILAVYGDAILDQSILANGRGTQPGAGGNQACALSKGANGSFSNREGGGGGGGGNGTAGAEGGLGFTDGARGTGGSSQSNTPQPLVGGCAGGDGGGVTPTIEGKGGAGGGALQISVARTLTVSKFISTSGGGGNGGGATGPVGAAGGGGGGSGGQVVLEALKVTLTSGARLTANGGGGGEGGGAKSNGGSGGSDGNDGSENSSNVANGGINGNVTGGGGGAGGAGTCLLYTA
ncbi:hypothetical protein D7V97_17885, partial [Corallococcus sp. CA053C]|uniref:putative metal-binding motif-containing protein n=1 Tax=Corallococcus sp. CA053C TaxID=2316732 RepID=UPI000EA2697E